MAEVINPFLQPVRSAVDYQNDFARADAMRNQNALQGIQLRQAGDVQTQRNALRSAVQGGQVDLTSQQGQANALTLAPDVAPALIKTVQDGITSGAAANKDNAQAANFKSTSAATDFETQTKKYNKAISDITSFSAPSDAIASILQHLQSGSVTPDQAKAALSSIPQDPVAFRNWKVQMLIHTMDQKDQVAALTPKVDMVNTGGAIVPTNTNATAGPVGPIAGAAPIKTTVSPDAQLQANTSVANTRANIQKDYKVAGLDANGNFVTAPDGTATGTVKQMGDALGRYDHPESVVFARVPPALKGQVMDYVHQTYPDYDPTLFATRAHAAKDFTDGPLGNMMRSNSTAQAHLDQLTALAGAMNNGDVRLINTIANAYGVQTGQPAAQVFNAVRNIVGQEVVKAIVAGGGGEGERKAAADAFDPSSSPQQFLQTVGAVKHVMGAQNENLLAQRRAAGLKDGSLPNYNGAGGAGAAPAGFVITHVNGKPQ